MNSDLRKSETYYCLRDESTAKIKGKDLDAALRLIKVPGLEHLDWNQILSLAEAGREMELSGLARSMGVATLIVLSDQVNDMIARERKTVGTTQKALKLKQEAFERICKLLEHGTKIAESLTRLKLPDHLILTGNGSIHSTVAPRQPMIPMNLQVNIGASNVIKEQKDNYDTVESKPGAVPAADASPDQSSVRA